MIAHTCCIHIIIFCGCMDHLDTTVLWKMETCLNSLLMSNLMHTSCLHLQFVCCIHGTTPFLLFFAGQQHDTLAASVLSRTFSYMRDVSVLFVAVALLRQARNMVRLLGSRLTLWTGAVFPHKLKPSPRGCLCEIWPRCLTACDLSGSASHGSKLRWKTRV